MPWADALAWAQGKARESPNRKFEIKQAAGSSVWKLAAPSILSASPDHPPVESGRIYRLEGDESFGPGPWWAVVDKMRLKLQRRPMAKFRVVRVWQLNAEDAIGTDPFSEPR